MGDRLSISEERRQNPGIDREEKRARPQGTHHWPPEKRHCSLAAFPFSLLGEEINTEMTQAPRTHGLEKVLLLPSPGEGELPETIGIRLPLMG